MPENIGPSNPQPGEDDELLGEEAILADDVDEAEEDESIDLGRFEIKVSFDGDVRITNLTRRFWFYDHPHIREGVPCLGNIQEGVAKLIGTYQFAAVSQVLIDFLQLVNPKEWVVSAHYWRDHGGSVSHD